MDFRSYLQKVDPIAYQYTGNDARIDLGKVGHGGDTAQFSTTDPNRIQSYVTGLYNQFQQSQFHAPNYLAGMGGSYATPAPNWDLNAIYNQAGAGAAAQVNPYYTKQLQDFQNNQTQAKALEDQQRQLTLQNQQQQFTNTVQGNEISRGRSSQDALTQEQQIGQQADNRQQDQGQQFDEARIAQAKQQAQAGLTGSGQGNNQTLQSQTAHITQEARQGAQDTQDVAHQELLKARTFEDLSRSDVLAGQAKDQGGKQVQVDWDKFIQGQASSLQQQQGSLEQQRLQRLGEVQKQLAQQNINARIHALSNPNVRAAATSAYAGAF